MRSSALASWLVEVRPWWRWTRPVLLSCVVLGLVALSLGGGSTPPSPSARGPLVPQKEINGPFWSLEDGFESSLMLSNTADEPIRVEPWVYDPDGRSVPLEPIALREFERQQVDVRSWLTQAGVRFTSGNLLFRHTGSD